MKRRLLLRRFADLSLGRKLGVTNAAGLLVAGVLICVALGVASWATLRGDLSRNGRIVATMLAQNVAPAIQFEDPVNASELLSALSGHPEVTEAVLYRTDGEMFARYSRQLRPAGREVRMVPDAFSGLRVSVPVEAQGNAVGELRLDIDMEGTYRRVLLAVTAILLVVLAVLGMLLLLQARLVERLLAPVHALVAGMRRAGDEGDYSQRVPVGSRDEIGELGDSFNAMMELVEERDRAMEHLAMHDSLTGLVNRHYLRMRARLPDLHEGRRAALLYIDLDNFKAINDTIDHNFGDRVLAAVANRLMSLTDTGDVLARFAGDEFVLCASLGDGRGDPEALAEQLRRAIGAPLQLKGRELLLRASVGIAIAPDHGTTVGELLQKADAAMHVVKDNGRDGVQCWNAAITQRANQRFALETELRQAMQAGQLSVAYQPIIELGSGRVTGMEALVRWQHPERGMVPPAEFVPVAEESGLIVQLGAWVLERACLQVRRWHAQYGPLHLAVNVSGRQFRDPALVDTVRAACERSGFPAHLLHLEVTESTLMQDTEAAARVMRQLVGLGLKLSLDDFGTGYSSLAYLKRFPLHKIKIDRSFVKDLPHNADDGAIVKAIVNLSRALDMRVLAEGIETEKQHLVLGALGCDFGQGYLYSKPLAPKDFEQYMAQRHLERQRSEDDPPARY